MEQLISDIERYCADAGIQPQNMLKRAINANWRQWEAWKTGASSPRFETADRIRAWMAANPPEAAQRAGQTREAAE